MSDLPIKISLFGNEIKENVCQMQLCYESNFRARGIRKMSNTIQYNTNSLLALNILQCFSPRNDIASGYKYIIQTSLQEA